MSTKACDCHIHVFDGRYPMVAGDARRVPDASVADYRQAQSMLGTDRVVLVQPSTYGADNACMLVALTALGASARGVAVVDMSVTDGELEALDRHRVRAIRFNLARPGATTIEMLRPLASRVDALGWHVQLHMTPDQIVEHEGTLASVRAQLVFDHMARIPSPHPERHRAFAIVTRLAQAGRAWVKLSGPYLFSPHGAPAFDEVDALARALVGAIPDRVVWGSDWPHPGAGKPVDLSRVLEWRARWLPDARLRQQALVDNPAQLYGFAEAD